MMWCKRYRAGCACLLSLARFGLSRLLVVHVSPLFNDTQKRPQMALRRKAKKKKKKKKKAP